MSGCANPGYEPMRLTVRCADPSMDFGTTVNRCTPNGERVIDHVELDGERFERVRECKNAAMDGFKCTACGERWLGGFGLGPIPFERCPSCGARVRKEAS